MKRVLVSLLAGVAVLVSCSKYDDAPLNARLDELEKRVDDLTVEVDRINGDVDALWTMIAALRSNCFVSLVEETETSWTISFSNGQVITLNKGTQLQAPVIGVAKAEDGLYYWTLNGEFIIAPDGKKVCAEGTPISPGGSFLPVIKAEDGKFYISYDGKKTWIYLADVADAKIPSMFSSVTQANGQVVFTLRDGGTFVFDSYVSLTFSVDKDSLEIDPECPVVVNWTVTGGQGAITVKAFADDGLEAVVGEGTVTISCTRDFVSGQVMLIATDSTEEPYFKQIKITKKI